jgi:hypothetical protein
MKVHVENGMGDSLDSPSLEQMRAFLFAIDADDEEHGAAWLSTEDGRSLEWNGDGRLVFSREGHLCPPLHLQNVSREQALELWSALARADLATVEREPWQPGNGYVHTPEKEAEIEAMMRRHHRELYDVLGAEREEVRCGREGCTRGAILHGIFCRPHHFESVNGIPSPFDD